MWGPHKMFRFVLVHCCWRAEMFRDEVRLARKLHSHGQTISSSFTDEAGKDGQIDIYFPWVSSRRAEPLSICGIDRFACPSQVQATCSRPWSGRNSLATSWPDS